MVEELDVHGFGRLAQLAGNLNIGCTRSGISARVIVYADDGRGALTDRFSIDLPGMCETAGRGTGRDFHLFQQSVLPVQTEYPKFLDRERCDLSVEMLHHQVR